MKSWRVFRIENVSSKERRLVKCSRCRNSPHDQRGHMHDRQGVPAGLRLPGHLRGLQRQRTSVHSGGDPAVHHRTVSMHFILATFYTVSMSSVPETTLRGWLWLNPVRCLHQFSSVQSFGLARLSGGPEGRFSRDPLPVSSAEGPCEQFRTSLKKVFDIMNDPRSRSAAA